MLSLLSRLARLFSNNGPVLPALPTIIFNVEEHDRAYVSACDIICPYMRLHNKPNKVVTNHAEQSLRRAITMLDAVVTYRPTNWNALWIKGKALQALNDSVGARAAFQRAFELQDKNPDVAREYMFECLNTGENAEGVRAARHALTLAPQNAGLQANVALALLVAGHLADALVAADIALQLDPTDQISHRLRERIEQVMQGVSPQPRTLQDLD